MRRVWLVAAVLVVGAWTCQAPTSGGDEVAGPTTTGLAAVVAGEPWLYVGDTDQPAFENDWENAGTTFCAFRFRAPGEVDLYISAAGGTDTTLWTMPEGYRPSAAAAAGLGSDITASPYSETPVSVAVLSNGAVGLATIPSGDLFVFKGSYFLVPPEVTP